MSARILVATAIVLSLFSAKAGARDKPFTCPKKFKEITDARAKALGFKWGGQTLLFDVSRTVPFDVVGLSRRPTFTFQKISRQDRNLRSQLKKLKAKSQPNPGREIEMGQILVSYTDGESKAVTFTSRSSGHISTDDHYKALNESGILDTYMTELTHIHTHPRTDAESGLYFSTGDIGFYVDLKQIVEEQLGKTIKFRAYVLPNCDNCDDVVAVIELGK